MFDNEINGSSLVISVIYADFRAISPSLRRFTKLVDLLLQT